MMLRCFSELRWALKDRDDETFVKLSCRGLYALDLWLSTILDSGDYDKRKFASVLSNARTLVDALVTRILSICGYCQFENVDKYRAWANTLHHKFNLFMIKR